VLNDLSARDGIDANFVEELYYVLMEIGQQFLEWRNVEIDLTGEAPTGYSRNSSIMLRRGEP
jgi:hypothetical protein